MMEREKFMQEARLTVHRILEGKENDMMNLVQQAWAEGRRNVSVETLWAALDEAVDRLEQKLDSEAVYPTWVEWFQEIGVVPNEQKIFHNWLLNPIPADIAQKLGVKPKKQEAR